MSKESRPLIFLLVLISIVLFLAGFRLGKRVERIDQTYQPSPTPTKTVSPTPTNSPLQFSTYINSECALTFLYPFYLKENQISSAGAELKSEESKIVVSCDEKTVLLKKEAVADLKEADQRRVKDQRVVIYREDEETNSFLIYNILNGKWIAFEVSPNLTNLILATVDFVK